jgi:hypothetical protein
MHTHPFFTNLLLHSDQELSEVLGAKIKSREIIHAWPLSCVESIVLDTGKKLIYKSQLPPTVEPLFYQSVSSKLLPGHQYLGRIGECETMTIDWIDAPLLSSTAPTPIDLLNHGRQILAALDEIQRDVPVYLNIGSTVAWTETVKNVLEKLSKLILIKRFRSINPNLAEEIKLWALRDNVLETIVTSSHLIHGDLKADQIFITPDGYKVIDWQRPAIAPSEIDLVSLLIGQQIDPLLFVSPVIVQIFWFVRLHWAVEAQAELFPDRRWPLFEQWASEAISGILLAV